MKKIAIIPAADLGTRMSPYTDDGSAKEGLPIAGRPALHHALYEAYEAEVDSVWIVYSAGKKAEIEKLANSFEYSGMIDIGFVGQIDLSTGLAGAIKTALHSINFVYNSYEVAVILPDVILKDRSFLKSMWRCHNIDTTIVAVNRSLISDMHAYDIVYRDDGGALKIVEKPAGVKPSGVIGETGFAITGRYILSSFICKKLRLTNIDFTTALADDCTNHALTTVEIDQDEFYDCGSWAGWRNANVDYELWKLNR